MRRIGLIALVASGTARASSPPPLPASADEAVRAAYQEAVEYPEDYGAWAELGQAAETKEPALSVEAWTHAQALSGGNLESLAAQVKPLLLAGQVDLAHHAAHQAVALAPDQAHISLIAADALRHPRGNSPIYHAALRSHRVIRGAVELAPEAPWVQCGLGYSRARLANRIGARRAFSSARDLGDPCGQAGLDAVPLRPTAWAGLTVAGLTYSSDQGLNGGLVTSFSGGVQLWDLVHGALTLRSSRFRVDMGDLLDLEDRTQTEVWGRLGAGHTARGITLLAAAIDENEPVAQESQNNEDPSITETTISRLRTRGTVFGARVWASHWATVRLDGALSSYEDGRAWQGELALSAPVLQPLTLEVGGQLTSFTGTGGSEDRTGESGTILASGSIAARYAVENWSLTAGARLGPEFRPVRMPDSVVWNLDRRILGSAHLGLSYSPNDLLTTYAGYEQLQLEAESAGANQGSTHIFSAGLTATFGGTRQ